MRRATSAGLLSADVQRVSERTATRFAWSALALSCAQLLVPRSAARANGSSLGLLKTAGAMLGIARSGVRVAKCGATVPVGRMAPEGTTS